MEIVDYGNPAYDDDNNCECSVCGKPMSEDGVCSSNCFEADMR